MKYEYINATGKTEIEVDERFYEILVALDREEYNSDRKHSRRHPLSLEGAEYEGEWFSDGADLLGDMIRAESEARLHAALGQLTPDQQALIHAVYFGGVPVTEYAKREGVDHSAISHRLQTIYKKLKKFL